MIRRPTRAELVRRLEAAITTRIGAEQLRQSNAVALSRAFAGVADAIYSLVEFMHRQQFVMTAEGEYLDRHGGQYGIDRYPAAHAQGAVKFTVQAGSVPDGTVVQTADGHQYRTTSSANSSGVAPVVAIEAGTAGNAAEGITVTLLTPLEGVLSTAVVSTAITGGVEIESDEAYRARILQRTRDTPMGGAKADYVRWALQVEGVEKAWCYPLEGGTDRVAVRFLATGDRIPDAAHVQRVQDHINEVRPVTAVVTVHAPVEQPVVFNFSDIEPDTLDVRARISSELAALFTREAEPGGGIYLSRIRQAISGAAGEVDFTLTSPAGNLTAASPNHILTFGGITW